MNRQRALTNRAILLGALTVVVVGVGAVVLLLTFYGGGSAQDQVRLDAIKTAGTIVVGTGGAVALLLAARRQRSAELTLQHQQDVARQTEHDANERRITDLYTKAADQLGSEKAPVRLAGLYALERLGESNPDQRQTIVNVVCAYLRMPFRPPGQRPQPDTAEYDLFQERTQEHQVRLTAQRILHTHRRNDQNKWSVKIDLDDSVLIGAYLPRANFAWITCFRADLSEADLSGCDLTGADLTATTLRKANLNYTTLLDATLDEADLRGAKLAEADLSEAVLTGGMWDSDTVWPADAVEKIKQASSEIEDGQYRIGPLRLPKKAG